MERGDGLHGVTELRFQSPPPNLFPASRRAKDTDTRRPWYGGRQPVYGIRAVDAADLTRQAPDLMLPAPCHPAVALRKLPEPSKRNLITFMPGKIVYERGPDPESSAVREQDIESDFIEKLRELKYVHRTDIRDRGTLEKNFREKFEALNRVRLTDAEFARLLDEIVTPDVFTAAKTLRSITSFTRDDGTPLNYTLVNIKDWCKNTFEVVNQLRINTDNSHHRYDVLILINGVPCVQIELKTLGIQPRRAMEQIVDYKNDPGNGYTKTLLCFLQLFIVSNRDSTYYFANNNARHFAFNADERFLPIYQFADEANKKITHLDDFAATFLVKCTLGKTISRYMVLIASEQKLLMMRPYQVYAVKHMVNCIHEDSGNGYIWHSAKAPEGAPPNRDRHQPKATGQRPLEHRRPTARGCATLRTTTTADPIMAFTDIEIAGHTITLEEHFWSRGRPPLHLRDKVREGQRFTDQSIELFLVRPAFNRPGEHTEEPIAKVRYVRSKNVWRLFWKRSDGKWHGYPPQPEAESLAAALAIIHEDANACFFG